MQSVAICIQLGSVTEIEYTISDDGGVPSPSDPLRLRYVGKQKVS